MHTPLVRRHRQEQLRCRPCGVARALQLSQGLIPMLNGALGLLVRPVNQLPRAGAPKGSGNGRWQGRAIVCHPCDVCMACRCAQGPWMLRSVFWLCDSRRLSWRTWRSWRKRMMTKCTKTCQERSPIAWRKTPPSTPSVSAPVCQVSARSQMQAPSRCPAPPAAWPERPQERQTATQSVRLLPRQKTPLQSQQILPWPEVPGTRGTASLSPHQRLRTPASQLLHCLEDPVRRVQVRLSLHQRLQMHSRWLLPCLRLCPRRQTMVPKLWALLGAS